MTDKDRIDFLERSALTQSVSIDRNSLIGSQSGEEEFPIQIFTIVSQHQRGKSVRELIDVAMDFESGKRNWKKENWVHSRGLSV